MEVYLAWFWGWNMSKSSTAEKDRRPQRRGQGRRTASAEIPVHESSDPGVGAALVAQLKASMDEGGMITAQHREIVASLRRHLDGRSSAIRAEIATLPPYYEGRLRHLVEAVTHAAARGAAIEDAISHVLMLGGLLGELERLIILRLLVAIESDLEAARVELVEATMEAAWVDHGGPG